MNINELILNIEKKLKKEIQAEKIEIQDKTYLHKSHSSHTEGKHHILLSIKCEELKKMSKIEYTKKIYKILDFEMKNFIHSIVIKLL